MLLLVGPRERPGREPAPEPRRIRLPWRPMPPLATTVALTVVAARGHGVASLVGAIGAFTAACRTLDVALPYRDGLREHRQ